MSFKMLKRLKNFLNSSDKRSISVKAKSKKFETKYKYCQVIQHANGYNYTIGDAVNL